MTAPGSGWESLDPWEKAAQWKEVAPEITEELVRLAKAKAVQDRREQAKRADAAAEAAEFERQMAKDAAARSHELELARLEDERKHRERQDALEAESLDIRRSLQNRLWWLQLVALLGGLLVVTASVIVGLLLVRSGESGAPATAVFGLGSTVTVGLLGANVAAGRRLQAILRKEGPADTSRPNH